MGRVSGDPENNYISENLPITATDEAVGALFRAWNRRPLAYAARVTTAATLAVISLWTLMTRKTSQIA
jgi:hypothetical protein